jgi:hypothetical protein
LRHRQAAISAGKLRIKINGLLEASDCHCIFFSIRPAEMPPAPLVSRPGIKVFWRLAHRSLTLGTRNRRSDGHRDRLADLVLDREDVGQIAVVTFGPDMITGLGLDQLRGHPDTVSGFAQATF